MSLAVDLISTVALALAVIFVALASKNNTRSIQHLVSRIERLEEKRREAGTDR